MTAPTLPKLGKGSNGRDYWLIPFNGMVLLQRAGIETGSETPLSESEELICHLCRVVEQLSAPISVSEDPLLADLLQKNTQLREHMIVLCDEITALKSAKPISVSDVSDEVIDRMVDAVEKAEVDFFDYCNSAGNSFDKSRSRELGMRAALAVFVGGGGQK